MLPKPAACMDCLWYADGQGFVPDEVPAGARLVFVAQNPGETEEEQGRPLIGVTGQIWRQQFVKRYFGGVKVGYANIIHCRRCVEGRRSNQMPPLHSKEWWAICRKCRAYLDESLRAASDDAIIVPCGEYALAALGNVLAPGRRKPPMLHVRGTWMEEYDEKA